MNTKRNEKVALTVMTLKELVYQWGLKTFYLKKKFSIPFDDTSEKIAHAIILQFLK